jgi:hypothetical protein
MAGPRSRVSGGRRGSHGSMPTVKCRSLLPLGLRKRARAARAGTGDGTSRIDLPRVGSLRRPGRWPPAVPWRSSPSSSSTCSCSGSSSSGTHLAGRVSEVVLPARGGGVARTVARTFKDFILGAAAVFVVKPRNAVMASQRKATPATTRDRPRRAKGALPGHALPMLYLRP